MSAPPAPLAPLPHVRRVTYRLRSTDVRKYALRDSVRRAQAAAQRAGGAHVGRDRAPYPVVRRWCVLRSPHVNKRSREHFCMRIFRRQFDWDAPAPAVPDNAEHHIAAALPANVATRVDVDAPALLRLRALWNTMQSAAAAPPAPLQPHSPGAHEPAQPDAV